MALATCHIALMDPSVLHQQALDWDLDLTSTSFVTDFAQHLMDHASAVDCVGPTAQSCQSQVVEAFDGNGNPYPLQFPPNATCCALDKQCNWANQFDMTQAECTGAGVLAVKGSSFCGIAWGGTQLQDITQPPQCQAVTISNQMDCDALGSLYSWVVGSFGSQSNCYYSLGMNTSACLPDPVCLPTKTYLDQAISSRTFNPRIPVPVNNPECFSDGCCVSSVNSSVCDSFRNLPFPGGWSQLQQQMAQSLGWNQNVGLCLSSIWDRSTPYPHNISLCSSLSNWTAHTFQYHSGRQFQPGQWASQSDCSLGQCSIPSLNYFGVNASVCHSQTQCTQSCAHCKTYQLDINGKEQTICYDPEHTTQNTCFASGGQWDNQLNVCKSQLTTRSGCVAAGFRFFACSDLSNATGCSTQEWPYHSLGCQWQPFDTCNSATECSANGQCNDWEFNMCPGQASGSCPSGACVQPYQIDANGNRQWCSSNQQQSRIGCIDTQTTTSSACAAKGSGWQWVTKATTEAECVSHGSQCLSADWTHGSSNRSRTECLKCHGQFTPVYTFAFGEVVSGTQNPTTWQARAWVPKNQMISTVNWFLLSSLYNDAVAKVVARVQRNYLNAVYAPLIPPMKALVCSCLGGTHCFQATLSDDTECLAPPGSDVTCNGVYGSLTLSNDSIQTNSGVLVNQQYVPAGLVAAAAAASGTRGSTFIVENVIKPILLIQRTPSSSPYEIVKDSKGNVIGQIISGAVFPDTGSGNVTYPNSLTITINPTIPINPAYTVADFALAVNNSGQFTVGAPLGLSDVTLSKTTATGIVPASGVYFAIVRAGGVTT